MNKSPYQKLVDELGVEGANAEMRRRSSLRTDEQKNQGYFKKLKEEGRLDELKAIQSKGGAVPRVKSNESKD